MEESTVKITPVKSSKRLRSSSGVNDIGIKETSQKILPNGTGNVPENPENGSGGDKSQPNTVTKVGKKTKVDTPKSPQKSAKKAVKEPAPDATEESFIGFDDSEINKRRIISLQSIIDELGTVEGASTSQAVAEERIEEDTEVKETAEVEEQEMTVDSAAAVSDETDSDQMEIDDSRDEKSKESADVDIMDTESVKSENVKTDTSVVEKGPAAKVEYCGACSAQVDDAEEGICCDGACERWFHLKCSGLSQAEYNLLSLDQNAMWACPKCSEKPPPILPAEPKTPKISVRKDLQKTPGPSVAKRKSVAKEGAVKSPKINVSNPAYLKPFDFGWKRELVYRTSNENAGGKRNGDIYYYTPTGKKLRSLREISEHLGGTDLELDKNFTFWKEPLGVEDPEKEIIRDAKYKMANKDGTASPSLVAKKSATTTPKTNKTPKTTPKLTATVTPNLAHQVESNGTSATPKASASVPPRVVLKGKNSATPTLKVKIAPTKTVTPRPVISKGVEDSVVYRAMAEKTRSGLRSSRTNSKDFDFDTSDTWVATKTGPKNQKKKFRRYGLLANRRTSSPGSDDSSDSELVMEINPTKSQPKKRGRSRKKRGRSKKKPGRPKKEQSLAAPTQSKGESLIDISFADGPPIHSHSYLPEHNPSLLGLNQKRPVPPPVHFRPSNPSTYGCQKSPSMMPHSSSNQIHKSLDPEPSGSFEFVSVSHTKQEVRSTIETSLLSFPIQSTTTNIEIIPCITIDDEDDDRQSPTDFKMPTRDVRDTNTTARPPSVYLNVPDSNTPAPPPPHLYLEVEPPSDLPDPQEKKKKLTSDDEMELGMLPPTWDPTPKREKTLGVCNINCLPAMGTIPTQQCVSCLCLYHLKCVGLEEVNNTYKCKNCQLEKNKPAPTVPTNETKMTLPPPPLTPISTLNSTSGVTVTPLSAPPKLQRIADVRQATSRASNIIVSKSTSIVGGVTTWLPPSSTIQLRPPPPSTIKFSPLPPPTITPATDPSPNQPVQTLFTVAGTRYIVVPKHNILSVGPHATSSPEPSSVQTTTTTSDPNSALTTSVSQNFSTILPQTQTSPSTLIVSPPKGVTAFQNPPGVLLVPLINNQQSPNQLEGQQPQYVIVNNPPGIPSGNFMLGNIPQSRQLFLPTVPTCQASEPSAESAGAAKRALEVAGDSPAAKRLKADAGPSPFMKNLMQNMSYMHSSLVHAFQYLKVQELLRASRVNHLWHSLALDRSLWETVRMKNSLVKDWEGFAATLRRTRTRHLDLRKILVPGGKDDTDAVKTMWTDCVKALPKVDSLVKIDFCRCTSSLVQQIAQACPQLESILAVFIKDVEFDLIDLKNCTHLTELKLKSQSGIEIKNVDTLKTLKQLKTLSLLTIKNLNEVLAAIGELTQLETLELGEMTNIDEKVIIKALAPLTKLKRLRLEKGQKGCPTAAILKKVSELPNVNQLELINFDIKLGFDEALALCSNIKTLLIIPTYVTQSATTNHLVIEGVSKLFKTLNHFVWGLTLELLRVTDLFIDQWEQNQNATPRSPTGPKKGGAHDSIPILKPANATKETKTKDGVAVTQVDVLALPKLHKVLTTVLPNTKVIILKVPFTATWRQTINSNPN